jgi:hypothetical protein
MTQTFRTFFPRTAAITFLLLTFGAAAVQANPFSAIGSGAKGVAVTVANGTKKVAMVPVRGVQKVRDAF